MAHTPTELAFRQGRLVRIAIVCPYSIDVPGGVQQQAVDLTSRLRTAGYEAWLVAPGTAALPHVRLLGRSVGIRANGAVAPISIDPRTIRRTRHAVEDADVVHVHEPLLLPVSPAAFLGDVAPAVGTFHADPGRWVGAIYRLGSPALRRLLNKLRAVTAVSPAALSSLKGMIDRVVLIPNGVDATSFVLPVVRHPNRVVFLGRDEPRKGLDVVLKAWPVVRAAVAEAELVVLGADRSDSVPGVRFLGPAVGVAKRRELARAAVYCGPNLGGESFGISLVEAMAAGCAPVVSDLAAFRAVAGEAATYVSPGNPVALAARLVSALQDRAETERRGSTARKLAAAYDWEGVLPRYIAVYEQAAQ